MSFSVDVSKWVEKAKDAPETVVRNTALKLFSSIVISSPVDEGTFRNNWFVSGITPSSAVNPNDDGGSASGVINRTERDIEALLNWQTITFTNNLPYARVIEYGGFKGSGAKTINGYSTQAPSGVVRVNAMRFNDLIREEANKL